MAYGRDLAKFLAFLSKQKRALADIRRDDIVDFLASLYRQKLDSRSVARHLVTVRNFFRFAVAEGAVPADPTLTLESPKIRRSLPGYLRLEEVDRLLEQPDLRTPFGVRSEEHTSELQSPMYLVCRLLLEKQN